MKTLASHAVPASDIGAPYCEKCHSLTRLVGIEPHAVRSETDLRTFECLACQHMQIVVAPTLH